MDRFLKNQQNNNKIEDLYATGVTSLLVASNLYESNKYIIHYMCNNVANFHLTIDTIKNVESQIL